MASLLDSSFFALFISNLFLPLPFVSLILYPTNDVVFAQVYCPVKDDVPQSASRGIFYTSNVVAAITIDKQGTNETDNGASSRVRKYYECPGGDTPSYYTECCRSENRCCPSWLAFKGENLEIDENVAFTIAITVSSICLIFSIFLLVCCFWSVCPFYNSCRVRYTRDDAGCADKMGEVPVFVGLMPSEESPLGNTLVIAHPIQNKPKSCSLGHVREAIV